MFNIGNKPLKNEALREQMPPALPLCPIALRGY